MCMIDYSVMKRNELLINATTWMNPENMFSKIRQMQKGTHHDSTYTKYPGLANEEIQVD